MKVAFIAFHHEVSSALAAARSIHEETGETLEVLALTPEKFQETSHLDQFLEFTRDAALVIMHLMGGKSVLKDPDIILSSLKNQNVPVFAAGVPADAELANDSTVDEKEYQTIAAYINNGGPENIKNLLLFAANRFAGKSVTVNPPIKFPLEGIYHPKLGYVKNLAHYMEKKYLPERPTIGILCGPNPTRNTGEHYIDSLINELEHQGANAYSVFLSGTDPQGKNLRWVVENYFMKDGIPVVDTVISPHGHSIAAYLPSESVTDLFKSLGVPLLKAIATSNTLEQWQDSLLGLGFSEVSWNVAMPEFDGFIITVPVAAKQISGTDPASGIEKETLKPIPERIDKLARLSLKWAKLKYIPNPERKIAVIFHNYPPRNDNIGCAAGLDSAVSAVNLLEKMQARGYQLDFIPENGQDLMDTIINGLTNDQRWLSIEDLADRSVDKIPAARYAEWLDEVPDDARNKMKTHWGKPPGENFNYKDALLVPGLVNGNVFIGLQPPRACESDAADIYHNPEVPIPYHYHGYYRWIRDVFKADAVIHFGTHGTLEWLPGKSVGLSGSCFPDVGICDLPNIYPYIIHNPGEGTGAKRRIYACLVDYLPPVMHNADTYEDLESLDVQLKEYYRAKSTDPGKIEIQKKLIWETIARANLDKDFNVTREEVFNEFDQFLERLHGYLNELSDTHIQDGLHVLGEPPAGTPLVEFLVALTRLKNGKVPSLRQSIAQLKGYDYDALLANRGRLRPDNRTNGDVISELNFLCLELMEKFHAAGFKTDAIDDLMSKVLNGPDPWVRDCLTWISDFLVPALEATTDELTHTLDACAGRHVPPGPSGAPTRGTADILPTGRNFYSVDPRCIPSPAAWKVGVDLGDTLLARYVAEEGRYPESIGTVLWATDTMRTNGDCVAESLYLMGIRPVWEGSSGRVLRLEPIPLKELKRPRIDVTMRISGLFRDNFPNIVHLIDEAVEMVAALKEVPDMNYIMKHVEQEVADRTACGVDAGTARKEACYRIFGDKPGDYGTGVGEAIESKNWKDRTDLGNIYITWGGYVYSRENFGMTAPELFKRRLARIDATTKNMDTREYDALQIDDTYGYHAGMDLAVKTVRGKAPRSYYGDSSDPDRVKIRSTAEEIKYCFRARLVNPKWIQGLQKHGYHGAAEFSRQMDYVFGWDAVADVIEDWMYETLAEKFVLDPAMQTWLNDVNPYALQNMTERLLEAIGRDLWQASEEMKDKLQALYLDMEAKLEEAGEK